MIQWLNQFGRFVAMRLAMGAVLAGALLFGTGCADRECEPSSFVPRCDGAEVVSCETETTDGFFTESPTHIAHTSCGDGSTCMVDDGSAMCLPNGIDLTCKGGDVVDKTAEGLAAADVDEDGKLDVVVVRTDRTPEHLGTIVATHARDAQGLTPAHESFAPGLAAERDGDIAVADFDGDGHADVAYLWSDDPTYPATARTALVVLHGDGRGAFSTPRVGTTFQDTAWIVGSADVNGDGVLDVLVANRNEVNAWSAKDPSALVKIPVVALANQVTHTFRPITVDGRSLLLDATGGTLWMYPLDRGTSDRFDPVDVCGSAASANILALSAAKDIDGDGRPDLVAACGDGRVVTLLAGAPGTFTIRSSFVQAQLNGLPLALGDVNGDGKLDLVRSEYGGVLAVRAGRGDGTFGDATRSHPAHEEIGKLLVADLAASGSGRADAVVSGPGGVRLVAHACAP